LTDSAKKQRNTQSLKTHIISNITKSTDSKIAMEIFLSLLILSLFLIVSSLLGFLQANFSTILLILIAAGIAWLLCKTIIIICTELLPWSVNLLIDLGNFIISLLTMLASWAYDRTHNYFLFLKIFIPYLSKNHVVIVYTSTIIGWFFISNNTFLSSLASVWKLDPLDARKTLCYITSPLVILIGLYWQIHTAKEVDLKAFRSQPMDLPSRLKLSLFLSSILFISVIYNGFYQSFYIPESNYNLSMFMMELVEFINFSLIFMFKTYFSPLINILALNNVIWSYIHHPEAFSLRATLEPLVEVGGDLLPENLGSAYVYIFSFYFVLAGSIDSFFRSGLHFPSIFKD
jgi:hypothetical protein